MCSAVRPGSWKYRESRAQCAAGKRCSKAALERLRYWVQQNPIPAPSPPSCPRKKACLSQDGGSGVPPCNAEVVRGLRTTPLLRSSNKVSPPRKAPPLLASPPPSPENALQPGRRVSGFPVNDSGSGQFFCRQTDES